MARRDDELENLMPPTLLEWTEEAQAAMGRVPFFVRKAVVRSIEEYAREQGLTTVDVGVVARARQEKEARAMDGARPVAPGGPEAATGAGAAAEPEGAAAEAEGAAAEAEGAGEHSKRQFVNFAFYKVDPAWRRLPEAQRRRHKEEFAAAVEEFDRPGRLLVLSYSTVGIRADADLLLWRVGHDLELFNSMTARLNRTALGAHLHLTRSYLSMTRKSLYEDRISPEHAEERVRIAPGKAGYVFVYPFEKKREWYMLTRFTRQGMMDEHIYVGNKYPSVKLNTTYSFGLDDQEFVVAFETDNPEDFLDLVMELRETQASLYTLRDTPIFTCLAMPLKQALDCLG